MTLHEEEGAPVVVLGATGTTGSQVADLLEAADVRVRRASRRSPWRFDWDDASTWPSLFDGAGAVYVVLPEDRMDLTPFTRVLADAGVERAVVLTAQAHRAPVEQLERRRTDHRPDARCAPALHRLHGPAVRRCRPVEGPCACAAGAMVRHEARGGT